MAVLIDYLVIFWAGVLTSFTPCIYPVIPLTAGVIAAANERGTRPAGFGLSVVYVLGVAVTYCALAVIASLTGSVFGEIQNQPFVFWIVSGIFLFFSLVMFDVVPFLHYGLTIHPRMRPKDACSVFVFGLASGLVIGPCTAPILGTLLLYVASKQNVLGGILRVFVFSFGAGLSLIIVGTFSGALSSLPKSGPWLVRIKQFCGAVLFVCAIYFGIKAVFLF